MIEWSQFTSSNVAAYQIRSRHILLDRLVTAKVEECESYNQANTLVILATCSVLLSAVLQIILYLVYNRKVGVHLITINIQTIC